MERQAAASHLFAQPSKSLLGLLRGLAEDDLVVGVADPCMARSRHRFVDRVQVHIRQQRTDGGPLRTPSSGVHLDAFSITGC